MKLTMPSAENKRVIHKSLFLNVFLFVLLIFLAQSVFFSNENSYLAQAATPLCGQNINPESPPGFPSAEALLGVNWVRMEFRSCTFGNEEDSNVWDSIEQYRQVIDYYTSHNISVLLIIDYLSYPEALDNIDDFAERAGLIAQAYSGYGSRIAFQVWNEPDIWLGGSLSPDQFAEILGKAATNIKNSGGIVVSGSSASGQPGWVSDLAGNMDSMGYSWNTLIDYNALHPYGKQPAPTCSIPDGGGTGDLSESLNAYYTAGRNKPLWITEIGLNTDNQALQAEYLTCFYTHVRSHHAGQVANITWFAWTDAMVPPMGITDPANNPKASYSAYYSTNGCTQSGLPATTAAAPLSPVMFVIDDGAGCAAAATEDPSCAITEWPAMGEDVNEPQVTCACTANGTTTCDALQSTGAPGPTNQDLGQRDGTGSGNYNFFDNDIFAYINVPALMPYVSNNPNLGGQGGTGGPIIPPVGPSTGTCDGALFASLFNGAYPMPTPVDPYGTAPAMIRWIKTVQPTPIDGVYDTLEQVYKAIEDATGVPCEYMAGLHYVEGANGINNTFQNGLSLSTMGYTSLLQSGIDAAIEITDRTDGQYNADKSIINQLSTIQQLILADSGYGGGGNRQCLWIDYENPTYAPNDVLTNYANCPPATTGDDDVHTTNWSSAAHVNMAVIYPVGGVKADQFCAEGHLFWYNHPLYSACPNPIVTQRQSTLSIALQLWRTNHGL